MEVLGKSVVAMSKWTAWSSGCMMRMLPASGPSLTSSENRHSLRVSTAEKKLSVCVRHGRRRSSVNAVLMEPRNLSEHALLEFGRLSDELNPIASPLGRGRVAGAMSGDESSQSSQHSGSKYSAGSSFSGTVGEALTSHAKHKRGQSLEGAERMQREMIPLHELRQGGFVENCLMYRQIFVVRSYEVGADQTSSIDTIFSLFQEVALCHVHLLGIAGDGFGATRAMNRLGLIWVVTRMQVEVERFPSWPEVVEIDSWVGHAGKNGMRRDWIMRCYQTGEVLARATSTWCMMHATTRRLSKIPDEVRAEIERCFLGDRFSFPQDDSAPASASRIGKLDDQTARHLRSQLKSCRGDLDMNQHVNNLKYITWLLQSVPDEHTSAHHLTSMTLEYRRECQSTDVVESLTSPPITVAANAQPGVRGYGSPPQAAADGGQIHSRSATGTGALCHFTHLLRTQDAGKQEILRGRTTWRPRQSSNHTIAHDR